eukprot:COSAG01_NODE_39783_length_472_cov_0.828418_1_plen_72_part_00
MIRHCGLVGPLLEERSGSGDGGSGHHCWHSHAPNNKEEEDRLGQQHHLISYVTHGASVASQQRTQLIFCSR